MDELVMDEIGKCPKRDTVVRSIRSQQDVILVDIGNVLSNLDQLAAQGREHGRSLVLRGFWPRASIKTPKSCTVPEASVTVPPSPTSIS